MVRTVEPRRENIVFGVGIVLVVIYLITMFFLSAPKDNVQEVVVEDSTTYVDDTLVERELSDISVHQDMNMFVYVKEGSPEDNLNEDTLNYMRENHPELITGDKWTDGWFILSLNIESGDSSPGSGQVGTYFGEDVKVGESTQQSIQEEGYELFRERNWSGGLIESAEEAGSQMGKPFYGDVMFILISAGVPVAFLVMFVMGTRKAREWRHEAVENMRDHAEGVDQYIRNAGNVLVGEYASQIRNTSDDVLRSYTDLLDRRDKIEKLRWYQLAFNLSAIRSLSQQSDDFVNKVYMVSDAMTIYEKSDGWKDAWFRQTQDVRSAINGLLVGEMSEDREMRNRGDYARQWIEDVDRRLYEGEEDVDLLFKQVDEIQNFVSDATKAYMDAQLAQESNSSRRGYIRNGIEDERRRYRDRSRTSIFAYHSRGYIYTPMIYTAGHSAGISSYQSAQSSSSSSGYGGGGGGFSGAGSSSSF